MTIISKEIFEEVDSNMSGNLSFEEFEHSESTWANFMKADTTLDPNKSSYKHDKIHSKLSKAQLEAYPQAKIDFLIKDFDQGFTLLDSDKVDGFIDMKENNIGKMIQHTFRTLDLDRNGLITFEELNKLW